jgi:hypothetical protein
MKPTFFALTALGALAAAAPALAQGYGYGSQGNNDRYYNNYNSNRGSYYDDRADANLSIGTRIARLETRLNAGVRAGTIYRDEAMRLRAELRDLRRMSSQYGYGGVDSSERADLMARLRGVGEDIAAAEGDGGYGYNGGSGTSYGSGYGGTYGTGTYGTGTYGTGNGYGSGTYGNGYGAGTYGNAYSRSYDSGSGSYATSNNGYANSNNGYYGRGGPYEDADGYATLRVGDRATGNLYGVPTELRGTYRDGYGYYYRSDGQAVYQIDSRSGTVLRVYPMNR